MVGIQINCLSNPRTFNFGLVHCLKVIKLGKIDKFLRGKELTVDAYFNIINCID